jgi:hypothetical protein
MPDRRISLARFSAKIHLSERPLPGLSSRPGAPGGFLDGLTSGTIQCKSSGGFAGHLRTAICGINILRFARGEPYTRAARYHRKDFVRLEKT